MKRIPKIKGASPPQDGEALTYRYFLAFLVFLVAGFLAFLVAGDFAGAAAIFLSILSHLSTIAFSSSDLGFASAGSAAIISCAFPKPSLQALESAPQAPFLFFICLSIFWALHSYFFQVSSIEAKTALA